MKWNAVLTTEYCVLCFLGKWQLMMDDYKCMNRQKDRALERCSAFFGEGRSDAVGLTVLPDEDFFAQTAPDDDTVQLNISAGVLTATKSLWHDAMTLSDSLPEEAQLNVGDVDQAIDASLQWLILHELHHYQMGHFKLVGGAAISETSHAAALGLTSRSAKGPVLLDALPMSERLLARRCLELQADHDATEMLLDGYSTDGWPIVRFYAASIFAMMVLIEQQEPIHDDDRREYPKAATRIFQMLGYLRTMWMVPAMLKAHKLGLDQPRVEDLPSNDEVEAFLAEVVAPAFSDAVLLAQAGGMQRIVDGLGDPTDFIADINRAQSADGSTPDDYLTAGGREYAELEPINAKVLALLDIDSMTA